MIYNFKFYIINYSNYYSYAFIIFFEFKMVLLSFEKFAEISIFEILINIIIIIEI